MFMALCVMTMSAFAVSVNLNFFVGNEKIFSSPVEAGGTYTLDDYDPESMSPYECREYKFVGWRVGTPVKGDTVPHMDTEVTPIANVNIYAVFYKAVVNDYTRITTVEELEPDIDYLIVSNHVFGGENHYYAMNGIMGTYEYDKFKSWGKLGAERVYPVGGTIHDPLENCVWRLHSRTESEDDPGKWWWSIGNQGLYIGNTKKYWFLNSPADAGHTGVVINAINGNFEMKSYARETVKHDSTSIFVPADTIHLDPDTVVKPVDTIINDQYYSAYRYDTVIYPAHDSITRDTIIKIPASTTIERAWWYLKYVDDEITMIEDFFITGSTMNDYPLYLFKKESAYTSYLSCVKWTSHLDAVEGYIDSVGGPKHRDVTEDTPGWMMLPKAYMAEESGCTGWSFIGWSLDQPVKPTNIYPTVRPADAWTKPLYNGETLYAVYANGIKYEKVDSVNQLKDGDILIAVLCDPYASYPQYAVGNRVVTFDGYSDNLWESATTEIENGDLINNMVSASWEWTYRAYDKTLWNGVHPLARDENQDKYAFKINSSSGSDPSKVWLSYSKKDPIPHWLSFQYDKTKKQIHWLTMNSKDGSGYWLRRDDKASSAYSGYVHDYWEYKVYRKTNGKYARVKHAANLNDGDSLVIVMVDPWASDANWAVGNLAVTYDSYGSGYYITTDVTIAHDTITSAVTPAMEWVYNASDKTLSYEGHLMSHGTDGTYQLEESTETKHDPNTVTMEGASGRFWLRYESSSKVVDGNNVFCRKDDVTETAYKETEHYWNYDIYRYSNSSAAYKKVTSTSSLNDGDKVIIVMVNDWNDPHPMAVAYSSTSNSRWNAIYVESDGEKITSHVYDQMKWTYNADDKTFSHNGHLLAHAGDSAKAYTLRKIATVPADLKLKGNNASFWLAYDEIKSTSHWLTYEYDDGNFCDNGDEKGGNANDYWEYRLFRKAGSAQYTSYPHCAAYAVNLHGCGGTVNAGDNSHTVTLHEDASGQGLILPTATADCEAEGWEFVGWFQDEDKQAFQREEFNDFLPAGERFIPVSDGVDLYAIYKKKTDKFRIVRGGPSKLVTGDDEDYLITYYTKVNGNDDKYYDFELSSNTKKSGNYYYCTGKQGESPQNGDDFYMIESDEANMWHFEKPAGQDYWYVKSAKTGKYLKLGTSGSSARTELSDSPQPVYMLDAGRAFEYNVSRLYNGTYYTAYCNANGLYTTSARTWDGSNGIYAKFTYVYRRLNEYTSWPHCKPFSVHFVGCGGTAEETDLVEPARYQGVITPEAYASVECAKLGWTFAGWYKRSIDNEINQLTFDLVPPNSLYHPAQTSDTLYAVYQQKTDKYKRITSTSNLYLGGIYIVATAPNASKPNMALTNTDNGGSVTAVYTDGTRVYPDAKGNIINENPAIDWYLRGQWGEYVFYNPNRGVYLDMYEPRTCGLTTTEHDQVDITFDEANPNNGFKFRSVQSIAHNASGYKYLSYKDNYFRTVRTNEVEPLAMYRQECFYISYPICHQEVQAIYWRKGDGGDTDYHVTVEAYELGGTPDMHGSMGTPKENGDGTLDIQYHAGLLPPCSRSVITWGGATAELRIPFIVNKDMNSADLLGGMDCDTCDVYVMSGNTLTINEDRTVRIVTVQDGATLNIQDGAKLRAQQVVLFSEGDQSAPIVNLNNTGRIVLKNGELYVDRRIDENRWYWFTLPFDAKLKDVTYSNEEANGGAAKYYENYWIKYYNGKLRAFDADNHGGMRETYWRNMPIDTTVVLHAGQGYQIGIADQKNEIQHDGRKHTKRIMRFTMRPDGFLWNNLERGTSKTAPIEPSNVVDPRVIADAGWNLIGNPYMRTYNTGNVTGSNLVNGAWTQEYDATGKWTGYWILDDNYDKTIPYLTIYNPGTRRYSQVPASNYEMRPNEAVFIQALSGTRINFAANASISSKPSSMMVSLHEVPLRTGIKVSGRGEMDRTGVVLDDQYTAEYEIGGDLLKSPNTYYDSKIKRNIYSLDLYTFNADKRMLAFNGMSDDDAIEPIPVGVTFPRVGEYTFSFDEEWYDKIEVDTMMLYDAKLGIKTNLLLKDYTVNVEKAGKEDDRFFLLIRRVKRGSPDPTIPTVLVNEENEKNNGTKIIRNGILYILRNGKMYDVLGAEVEE